MQDAELNINPAITKLICATAHCYSWILTKADPATLSGSGGMIELDQSSQCCSSQIKSHRKKYKTTVFFTL